MLPIQQWPQQESFPSLTLGWELAWFKYGTRVIQASITRRQEIDIHIYL